MRIVAKEVKTIIRVEISEEEFADQYHAMMQDIVNECYHPSNRNINKVDALSFIQLNDADQIKVIQENESPMMTKYGVEVIRYIAYSQGMNVEWFGGHNRHIHSYKAHFSQDGARL